ncbi:MAG: transposase [candidate division NC10 bacterium]|nr:transposase [candidate division NC10 bacterium]
MSRAWAPPSRPSSSPSSGTSPGTTKFSQLRKLAGLDIVRLESGQWVGTARISRCGRPLLRWALVPGGPRGVPECGVAGAAGGLHHEAAGGSLRVLQGDRGVGREAFAPCLGRLAEWAAL